MSDLTLALALVGIISIACQFTAHKVKLPAILFLLVAGIFVGPVTGVINADDLFGDLLFPVVSLSVAIILFEGALTLKIADIGGHGAMVRNLCSIGVLVTWLVVTPLAYIGLDIPLGLAALFAAIVTVTGPTVIVPMLRTVRPKGNVANILRWEGIVIDPIGALFAVLVFEFLMTQQDAFTHTLWAFGQTVLSGLGFGAAVGYFLGRAIRGNWFPHYLQNTAVLTIVLGVFALSNAAAHESGLLTVTVAGMILANMKNVNVDDILEFKETLSVLLISGLFILLASRIDFAEIQAVGFGAIVVIVGIIFIARPLGVFLSSFGTGLSFKELALLSWIAPRGIVAAAVSALFSLKLEEQGYEQASVLVPVVFLVIITTVVLQSLTSTKVAEYLDLREPEPNGFLLFGASDFTRALAKELNNNNISSTIADPNWDAIKKARMESVRTYFGNPISDHASRRLDLTGIGNLLVLSPYRQLNPMVMTHFEHEFGHEATILGLATSDTASMESHQISEGFAKKLTLFGESVTYGYLASAMKKGAIIKTTNISEDFTFQDYLNKYDRELIPLISISGKKVGVFKSDKKTEPKAGWKIVSLILNPAKVASEKKLEAAKAAGSIKDGALPSDPEPEK
ncbi:cation:proton antiporter [Psychrosphaera haliotis]|uniref:Sodium:proton antiporter n=1 Tax=Psychrosphaera haliotis TaxID=555083 RepID=A0A6N8FC16_9GAMM|nr:sodium:proton antiporter [Psychrosphaera haliotis]MUH73644.1 sodium:proton antiporter [Psychrosphaera haliotis]